MRSPKFLLLALALSCTSLFAQDLSDGDNGKTKLGTSSSSSASVSSKPVANAYAQELYTSGETKHNLGRVMSWGGLALSFAGSAANNSTLSTIGSVSLLVGIPVNGSGASDMVEAANAINPAAGVEMHGWGTYTASWVMMAGGIALIVNGFSSGTKDYYGDTEPNENMVVAGALVTIAGGLMQYVSWYQFSASADRAALAKNTASAYSFELAPALYASRKNGVLPGAQLALRF